MAFLMIFLSFQIIVALATTATGQKSCSAGASFERHINFRLRCGIFQTVALDYFKCQKKCVASLACFSTNSYRYDNRTEVCELTKGTETSFENSYCSEKKDGAIHSELTMTKNNLTRKALRDGWYQLGSSAFRFFKIKQTRDEAIVTCAANQASLAQFDSELEKQFVHGLVEDDSLTRLDRNLLMALSPSQYWALDGTDKDVVLNGSASYKWDDDVKTAVLDLPGTAGSFATTPIIPITKTSFTLSLWVKSPDLDGEGFAYSSYGAIHSFALKASYFYGRKNNYPYLPQFEITNNQNLTKNQWMHVVGVWDRNLKKAFLYRNGVVMGTSKSGATEENRLNLIDIKESVFDIGYKRKESKVMTGRIRDIAFFPRPFDAAQVKSLKGTSIRAAWIGSPPADSGCMVMRENSDLVKASCELKMNFVCKKNLP